MINDLDQTEIKVPYYELPEGWENKCDFSFEELSSLVIHIHESSYNSAVRAVNRMATIRNYIIGFYIVEYEQNGKDRSVYGSRLILKLAEKINKKGINETLLKVSRSFYLTYPQVKNYLVGKSATVSHQFETVWDLWAFPQRMLSHPLGRYGRPSLTLILLGVTSAACGGLRAPSANAKRSSPYGEGVFFV